MGKYEPGSLYKLVAFVMFMEERKIPIDTKVFCNGKYELEDQSNPGKPQIHRCWKEDGHGAVDLHDSMEAMEKAFTWQAADEKWSSMYDQVAKACGISIQDFEVLNLVAR